MLLFYRWLDFKCSKEIVGDKVRVRKGIPLTLVVGIISCVLDSCGGGIVA